MLSIKQESTNIVVIKFKIKIKFKEQREDFQKKKRVLEAVFHQFESSRRKETTGFLLFLSLSLSLSLSRKFRTKRNNFTFIFCLFEGKREREVSSAYIPLNAKLRGSCI